jgi:hypothetical protein
MTAGHPARLFSSAIAASEFLSFPAFIRHYQPDTVVFNLLLLLPDDSPILTPAVGSSNMNGQHHNTVASHLVIREARAGEDG